MIEQPQLVSVGICTRNRGVSIVATVQSILANTSANFELIIVDQSTSDKTYEALLPLTSDPRLRFIRTQERGISRSRNRVLAEARGMLLLMTDDDCTVPPDWIASMVDLIERHPNAALVFCQVDPPEDFDGTKGFIPLFACERETVVTDVGYHGTWGIGAGMGMRRDIIRKLGNFDAYLGAGSTFNSGEDTDLQMRAVLRGYAIVFSPQTVVIHHGFRSFTQFRKLLKRDMIGRGAALSKMIHHGDRRSGWVLAHTTREWLLESAGNMLRGRRPRGLRRLLWLYRGVVFAWNVPVDTQKLVFQLSQQQAEKLSFLSVDA